MAAAKEISISSFIKTGLYHIERKTKTTLKVFFLVVRVFALLPKVPLTVVVQSRLMQLM